MSPGDTNRMLMGSVLPELVVVLSIASMKSKVEENPLNIHTHTFVMHTHKDTHMHMLLWNGQIDIFIKCLIRMHKSSHVMVCLPVTMMAQTTNNSVCHSMSELDDKQRGRSDSGMTDGCCV